MQDFYYARDRARNFLEAEKLKINTSSESSFIKVPSINFLFLIALLHVHVILVLFIIYIEQINMHVKIILINFDIVVQKNDIRVLTESNLKVCGEDFRFCLDPT